MVLSFIDRSARLDQTHGFSSGKNAFTKASFTTATIGASGPSRSSKNRPPTSLRRSALKYCGAAVPGVESSAANSLHQSFLD